MQRECVCDREFDIHTYIYLEREIMWEREYERENVGERMRENAGRETMRGEKQCGERDNAGRETMRGERQCERMRGERECGERKNAR